MKTAQTGSTVFGLSPDGDVYLFDPINQTPFPDPILENTGATDLDAWGDAQVLFLNIPGDGVRIVDVSNLTTPTDIQTLSVGTPAIGQGTVIDLGQNGIRYATGGPSIVYSFVLQDPSASPTQVIRASW